MNPVFFKQVELFRTAYTPEQLLFDDLPQVAFIGRSNVGKSSLINHLMGRKKMAHTSSKPGKTLSINYYRIEERFYFVDLPGFGYAKVSQSEKKRAQELWEGFFQGNPALRALCFLIDSRHGFTAIDMEMLEKVLTSSVQILTIATKVDKISFSKQNSLLFKHQNDFNLSLIPYSVQHQAYRDKLLEIILKTTEVDHVFIKRP
jgi:GTP-binding protein